MFKNLRAEMARKGITNLLIAKELGINPATVSEKLTKPGRLKLDEAQAIRDKWFPELTIDYLFSDLELEHPEIHKARNHYAAEIVQL